MTNKLPDLSICPGSGWSKSRAWHLQQCCRNTVQCTVGVQCKQEVARCNVLRCSRVPGELIVFIIEKFGRMFSGSSLFIFFIGYQVTSRNDISERDTLKRHQHHRLGDYGTFFRSNVIRRSHLWWRSSWILHFHLKKLHVIRFKRMIQSYV